jgi:hypothetical protein
VPTTRDDQCHVNFFPKLQKFDPICWAKDSSNPDLNLDSKTCKYYKGQCYSTSAKQCKTSKECEFSPLSLQCKNKTGGGSLNCRLGLTGCKCIT